MAIIVARPRLAGSSSPRTLGLMATVALAAAAVLASGPALAAPPAETDGAWPSSDPTATTLAAQDPGAFDRAFGLATYYARWSGAYDANGLGGRVRWEPLEHFGAEVYGELLGVSVPVGTRFNVPVGFNLYAPLTILDGFRVRAMAGLCAMLIFDQGGAADAPESQDIQFGVHAGAGAEVALAPWASLFLDATYQGYWGHGHVVGPWTAAIDNELSRRDTLEVGLGLQLHL